MEACQPAKQCACAGVEDLPDSILLNIFSFLDLESLCLAARMVCSRWATVTFDQDLWRSIVIPDHFTDQRFTLLIQQIHSSVESLDCSTCENLTHTAFSNLAEFDLSKLTHLAVPIGVSVPDCVFEKLSPVCSSLQELENVSADQDKGCHPMRCQAMFSNLKVLHDKPMQAYGRQRKTEPTANLLKQQQWLQDLQEVANCCPKIDTYRCRRGLDYFTNYSAEEVSSLFPYLVTFEVHYCSIDDGGLEKFLAEQKGSLKEVILDRPGDISDLSLRSLADQCPDLEVLKVNRCTEVTNEGVMYLVSKCRHMREIHLNNALIYTYDEQVTERKDFSDECLAHIAAECPGLINFRIFYSKHITMSGLTSIALGCSQLHGILLYECSLVDDECLRTLLKLGHLRALVLVNCEGITPRGILEFILRAPSLLRLTLFVNNNNFYGDLSYLAADIFNDLETDTSLRPSCLRKLTLRGVSGAFTQLITVLCPSLHTVDLREANFIGTEALGSVIKTCEMLRTLDLQFLPKLGDEFLLILTKHATTLRSLGLGQTVKNITIDALEQVLAKCPSLAFISLDTAGSNIDEDVLVTAARRYHGGLCFLHVDPECRQDNPSFKHRLIELHFTPLKYLASIPNNTRREQIA